MFFLPPKSVILASLVAPASFRRETTGDSSSLLKSFLRAVQVTISDRSEGHNLVYNVATGQGGYGSQNLYELYLRTLDSVLGGRRRATERERHDRVVKPLSAIFKYLDQLHVDKGDCPDLKVGVSVLDACSLGFRRAFLICHRRCAADGVQAAVERPKLDDSRLEAIYLHTLHPPAQPTTRW